MDQKLFAFWKYDLFPFVLGSEIKEIDDDGYIATVSYGASSYFKPVLILPLKIGQDKYKKIQKIELEYRKAEIKLKDKYNSQIKSILEIDLDKGE